MEFVPLAEKLRPQSFKEIVGHDHLLGPKGFITQTVKRNQPLSIILFGPPGTGKTTIAKVYAKQFNLRFAELSGVTDTISDLRKLIKEMAETPLLGKNLLLFVDEIHRFNKAQQDAFLPLIENGTVILVGATAENPSFYLNGALLSRVRVLALNPLPKEALGKLLERTKSIYPHLEFTKEAEDLVLEFAQGDGRHLFNLIENFGIEGRTERIDLKAIEELLQKRAALYDKKGEQHYNLISALHKSVRGSDPDAALYWLARMLEGGEDPLFLARRMIRMASEDIGLADTNALTVTLNAKDTYETLGSPEGELALAEAIVYLALAPKSNSIYAAFNQAKSSAQKTTHLSPPKIILNAPTHMMKQLGYGKGYRYDHEEDDGFSGQNYFPDQMEREEYYQPQNRGFEREMQKRIAYFKKLRSQRSSSS